ncbi:MAG: response regulator [Nanobdellota archaeon]
MAKEKKKILIVDDEPHIVKLMRMTLEKKFEIHEAYTSHEAMNKVKEVVPDLILLDIMMPGEDGYQISSRLRQSKRFKDTPIIFVSAKNQLDDKMKSIDHGGDDYLTKPFDPNDLEKKVEANLLMKRWENEQPE